MLKVLLPVDGSKNSNRADNWQITGGISLILSVDDIVYSKGPLLAHVDASHALTAFPL